jgi:multicomponent Na+:H+ antiporter subunit E
MGKGLVRLILLALLWGLLSGHTEPSIVGFGVFSVLLVGFLAQRMDRDDRSIGLRRMGLPVVGYLAWLFKEIVLSNLQVTREILRPRLALTPTVLRVPASQRTALGRTLYANSITLTPGTVAVAVSANDILIHALMREGAESLQVGDMDRRVAALESRA